MLLFSKKRHLFPHSGLAWPPAVPHPDQFYHGLPASHSALISAAMLTSTCSSALHPMICCLGMFSNLQNVSDTGRYCRALHEQIRTAVMACAQQPGTPLQSRAAHCQLRLLPLPVGHGLDLIHRAVCACISGAQAPSCGHLRSIQMKHGEQHRPTECRMHTSDDCPSPSFPELKLAVSQMAAVPAISR